MEKYHYTYFITNLLATGPEKYYIGVRTCKCLPEHDPYMSSSCPLNEDKSDLMLKQILEVWPSRALAEAHEEWLHGFIDVGEHPEYYNKRNARTGFHSTVAAMAKRRSTILAQKGGFEKINKKIAIGHLKFCSTKKGKETIKKQAEQQIAYNKTIEGKRKTANRMQSRSVFYQTAEGVLVEQKRIRNLNKFNRTPTGKLIRKNAIAKREIHNSLNMKQCPHCKKMFTPAGYAQWHGDRCKIKQEKNA